jgi:hypothetical protein
MNVVILDSSQGFFGVHSKSSRVCPGRKSAEECSVIAARPVTHKLEHEQRGRAAE